MLFLGRCKELNIGCNNKYKAIVCDLHEKKQEVVLKPFQVECRLSNDKELNENNGKKLFGQFCSKRSI